MAEGISFEGEAYNVSQAADDERQEIMDQIYNAASSGAGDVHMITIDGKSYDISSGTGALVLDDKLQKISTRQQVAAQLVASKNRGEKEVHQIARG